METSLYNSDKYPDLIPSSSPKGWVFFCLQFYETLSNQV